MKTPHQVSKGKSHLSKAERKLSSTFRSNRKNKRSVWEQVNINRVY